MRWSEKDYQDYQVRRGKPTQAGPGKRQPRPPASRMNKTEQAYADHLDLLRAAGKVLWWAYEPVKLRLARKTFYAPDFLVRVAGGKVLFVEVKGFWRDDARIKIKVAADKFPMWTFVAVTKHGNGWREEWF